MIGRLGCAFAAVLAAQPALAFDAAHLQLRTRTPRQRAGVVTASVDNDVAAPPVDWFSGFMESSRAEDFYLGVDAVNRQVDTALERLKPICDYPFFRLYSVDMLASCAYLPQAPEECTLAECECLPADDDQIPEEIIERDLEEFEFALDGWARWDMPSDTYYDLQEYPEMNTKYEGAFIWNFVHDKICFKGEAEWKQDFNRAVSGFHASVSAHIVRSILEDGDEERALAEYRRRLREQKGAVENLYYATMIVLNACNVASERLRGYDYVDAEVNGLMDELLQMPLCCGGCVFAAQDNLQRHASYQGGVGLWQARLRARDLNRIINCVQCSLCRLHGKVGTLGLNTAMQILLGKEGRGGDAARMHRVEVAALVVALNKFLSAIQTVRTMEARLVELGQVASGEPVPMGGFAGQNLGEEDD